MTCHIKLPALIQIQLRSFIKTFRMGPWNSSKTICKYFTNIRSECGVFSSLVELCCLRFILQKNRPDKYWKSNSCKLLLPLNNFQAYCKFTLQLHSGKKQKSASGRCKNILFVFFQSFVLFVQTTLWPFSEEWAWRCDSKTGIVQLVKILENPRKF